MIAKLFHWQNLRLKFAECIRDESGAAMVEYLLITGIMVPAAMFLFYPDNGFYEAARNQFNLTSIALINPGP